MNNGKNTIPQYENYMMRPGEFFCTLTLAMGVCFAVGIIFYENIIYASICSFAGLLYIPLRKKELSNKRKEALNIQFKDALYFLSVSLSAGKSFETAILDTEKALAGIYTDRNSDLLRELGIIINRIRMNDPVEKAFYDLGQRSRSEDIKSFAEVIMISKRAGANLIEVVKNTSTTIREKMEIRQEIDNLIAGKKFEQKVMTIMPFAMIFFLKCSNSGFLRPLMTTAYGRLIMTVSLVLIIVGLLVGQKVMQIDV